MNIFGRVVRKIRTIQRERNFKTWFAIDGDNTRRLDYSLTPESIVFDLGGYKGDFAHDISKAYGCFVYLYEPVEKFHTFAVERFAASPKVHCKKYGLSDETGEFKITDDDNSSSVVTAVQHDTLETVQIKAFSDEVDELQIQTIDLLKINVEGSEFSILPHLVDTGYIKKVKNIQVQFHHFVPDAYRRRRKIQKMLSVTHDLDWCYPFVWESWSIRTNE
jgi:FkbM family methyltransferase